MWIAQKLTLVLWHTPLSRHKLSLFSWEETRMFRIFTPLIAVNIFFLVQIAKIRIIIFPTSMFS